jgi:hypothetical protein
MPILAFARTRPMVCTGVPPMSLAYAPKICSTRTRTVDLVPLLLLACPVRGRVRLGAENPSKGSEVAVGIRFSRLRRFSPRFSALASQEK